ncbi:MAG: PA2779 family protein [Bdellovibrio sp.]
MMFSKPFKIGCCISLSILMSDAPAVAMMDKMVSTKTAMQEMNRTAEEQNLRVFLNRDDVKKALLERGVSAEEASLRLANLSDTELKQLSGQIKEVRAGGDILVAILLIVLIIFLIKRI